MKSMIVLIAIFVILNGVECAPLWKVFCGPALYKGRIDPIVNPGKVAGHSHQVSGGNHFSAASASQNATQVYEDMMASSCTTCSIGEIDLSAYWHPDLYYNWPNGTFSVVPYSGLTVYYLSREPATNYSKDPSSPKYIPNSKVWNPIPKGLRMLAGNPYRRSYSGSIQDQAISYACLSSSGGNPERNGFPTNNLTCDYGLRAQVYFPSCWDGVNLDSADHKSHMAYPIQNYNGGDCPSTHPVRIPGVFFEAMYSVSGLDHGKGHNPFVWSSGDSTGYSFHGDFLSGWEPNVMAQAISDPTCDQTSTNNGNDVRKCNPFSKYVQDSQPRGACQLASQITLTEDLGIVNAIAALPGCNPITNGPDSAIPCSALPNATASSGLSKRFMLKSLVNNMFVTVPNNSTFPPVANITTNFTYFEVFSTQQMGQGVVSIRSEGSLQWLSASGDKNLVMCNRGDPSLWETFTIVPQTSGNLNNVVAIQSLRNNFYLYTAVDGTLRYNATTIGSNALFQLVTPDGGYVLDSAPIFIAPGQTPPGQTPAGNTPSGQTPSGQTPSDVVTGTPNNQVASGNALMYSGLAMIVALMM